MPAVLRAPVSILGRLCLVAIFLLSAIGNKIPQFSNVSQYMASQGVPAPQVMLAGAIAFLLLGGVSVLLGWWTRLGATLLLAFLVLATYYFHDFWTFEGAERQSQTIQFMKNLALMGSMLLLIANGPGAGSVDGRCGPPATNN
ncbi:MAG: DoxX family protein [Planctomycetaceae bacterium]